MIVVEGVEYITASEYAAESGHRNSTIYEARRNGLGGLAEGTIRHGRILHFPRPAIAAWRAEVAPRVHPRLPVLGPDGSGLGIYPAADLVIEFQRPGLRRDDDYDHLWGLVGPDGMLSAWTSPEAALLAAEGHTRDRPLRMRRDGADRFVLRAERAG